MNARDRILENIKLRQPELREHETFDFPPRNVTSFPVKFKAAVTAAGGTVVEINMVSAVNDYIKENFLSHTKILSALDAVQGDQNRSAGEFADLAVALLRGDFAVAENGAIWVPEKNMIDRAVPFICENLLLVIDQENILATMHDAYHLIENTDYGYGTFIAGPSKTADIEQSLVLGAHGPKTLTVFLMSR